MWCHVVLWVLCGVMWCYVVICGVKWRDVALGVVMDRYVSVCDVM